MADQAEKLRQLVKNATNLPHRVIVDTPYPTTKSTAKTRVIAVTSGKGGVGKTNLTVNLAIALQQKGQRVLVIDADFGMANVDVVLGCTTVYNVSHLLQEDVDVESVITEGPYGVRFLAGGSGLVQLADLTQKQIELLLDNFAQLDQWADIILIDTGAGISRNVLNFVVAADEVIVITTPEPTAITDAYAMMKALTVYQNKAAIKLIVNRALDSSEADAVTEKLVKVTARFLGFAIDSLGYIYDDPCVSKAVKMQKPFLVYYPSGSASGCIEKIAKKLVFGENITYSHGLRGFLHRFMEKVW